MPARLHFSGGRRLVHGFVQSGKHSISNAGSPSDAAWVLYVLCLPKSLISLHMHDPEQFYKSQIPSTHEEADLRLLFLCHNRKGNSNSGTSAGSNLEAAAETGYSRVSDISTVSNRLWSGHLHRGRSWKSMQLKCRMQNKRKSIPCAFDMFLLLIPAVHSLLSSCPYHQISWCSRICSEEEFPLVVKRLALSGLTTLISRLRLGTERSDDAEPLLKGKDLP